MADDTIAADSMVMKLGKIAEKTTALNCAAIGEYYQFIAFNSTENTQTGADRISEKQLIQRAEFWYKRALQLDSGLFDARYNLGTLYYNAGLREKVRRPDLEAGWQELFRKAAAEFELALLIRSKDMAVLDALKTIYSVLGDAENYERIRRME